MKRDKTQKNNGAATITTSELEYFLHPNTQWEDLVAILEAETKKKSKKIKFFSKEI